MLYYKLFFYRRPRGWPSLVLTHMPSRPWGIRSRANSSPKLPKSTPSQDLMGWSRSDQHLESFIDLFFVCFCPESFPKDLLLLTYLCCLSLKAFSPAPFLLASFMMMGALSKPFSITFLAGLNIQHLDKAQKYSTYVVQIIIYICYIVYNVQCIHYTVQKCGVGKIFC